MSDKIVRLVLKGAALLDATEAYLRRFVVYPSEYACVAHTLWVAHTHAMDSWESTPRMAFLGPEKGCGKSAALEVTEPLVPRPVLGVNFTPAYLFRKVGTEGERPTILYDEFDNLTASKAEGAPETRALINAGHRRNAVVGRCIVVGRRVKTEEIPAFSAVALAGIGDLPDTIGSRAVQIHMQRRAPDEPVEPFRYRIQAPQGHALCDQVSDWVSSIAQQLREARPEMPAGGRRSCRRCLGTAACHC